MNAPIHAPFTLADALDEHRAAIAAITVECSHWQTESAAHLATVSPDLAHAHAAA